MDHSDTPDPGAEKAKRKVKDDIEELKRVVEDADVVDVGKDPDYVPDSPRLQKQMGEWDDGE